MNRHTALCNKIRLTCGVGDVRLFLNPIGFAKHDDGRVVHYGVPGPGGSDLLGWKTENGVARFVAIEVKTGAGRLTKEQGDFIIAVQNAGGLAGVARSVSDAMLILNPEYRGNSGALTK